jgi:PAS domain S-box-containing protein
MHRAMEAQTPDSYEMFYEAAKMWFVVRLFPAPDGLSIYFQNVTEQKLSELARKASEEDFQNVFQSSNDAMFVISLESGIILKANDRARRLFQASHDLSGAVFQRLFSRSSDIDSLFATLVQTGSCFGEELAGTTAAGELIWFEVSGSLMQSAGERRAAIVARDISYRKAAERERQALLEREREARIEAETLNELSRIIAGQLDLETLVQRVTDAATQVSGAKFGAFFYNVFNEQGEAYLLYALSGAPREAFSKFGMPRNTDVFAPTFRGEGVVRVDDITADPRYGKNAPHAGMPKGHLPVRSYLAVPVTLRSGEVAGGLFFGHPDPGVFTPRAERICIGIASQAAVAIDNARLFQQLQKTVVQNKRQLAFTEAINVSLGEAVVSIDQNGIITFLNPVAERVLGWSAGELIGKEIHSAIHYVRPNGAVYPRHECPFLAVASGSNSMSSEEEFFVRKDGSLFPVSCTVAPIVVEGKQNGSVFVFRDISGRKAAEARLLEQAQIDAFTAEIGRHLASINDLPAALAGCTQTMVDHLDAAFARIWLVNESEQVLELTASSGMYTHLDGPHARVPIGRFKIGMIAANREPHLTNAVIGDSKVNQEWAIKQGMISFAGYPLIVEARVVGVIAMFARKPLSDRVLKAMEAVSNLMAVGIERKRAERNLASSENRFRSLVLATSQVVWTTNSRGEAVEDCPSWRELTGQTFAEWKGFGWLTAIHPEDRQNTLEVWTDAMDHQTPAHCEYRLRRADGEYRWVSSRTIPVVGDDGKVREWVGTISDITERKEAQHYLEKTVSQRTAVLRETIAELEAFSYSVSHDLRTPLRAMEGYAKAVLEDCGATLAAEHRGYLERIVRGASRLDRLTLDVLAYSRLSRTEFKPAPVDLQKLVCDIIDQYPQFQPWKTAIKVEGPLHGVLGHEAFLTQCISNLLGNAIKFIPKGASPDVEVWTEREGDMVTLNVRDHGIGIAPEHANRVFQIFGRVHHEKVYEGTGIGLAVVKKAVEKMGGTVGYDSAPGQGSRFWVQLPAA